MKYIDVDRLTRELLNAVPSQNLVVARSIVSFCEMLDKVPAADVVPNKCGGWKEVITKEDLPKMYPGYSLPYPDSYYYGKHKCSECGCFALQYVEEGSTEIYEATLNYCPICGAAMCDDMRIPINRDWLNSLSTVELVDWIKNAASSMSDAELLKWMEEKHNG